MIVEVDEETSEYGVTVTRSSGSAFYVTRAPMRICQCLCGVMGGAQPRPVWEEYFGEVGLAGYRRRSGMEWFVSSCDEAKRLAPAASHDRVLLIKMFEN